MFNISSSLRVGISSPFMLKSRRKPYFQQTAAFMLLCDLIIIATLKCMHLQDELELNKTPVQ